jgi:hypothetical protein
VLQLKPALLLDVGLFDRDPIAFGEQGVFAGAA